MIIFSFAGIVVMALGMIAPDVLGYQQVHQIAVGMLLCLPAAMMDTFKGRRNER